MSRRCASAGPTTSESRLSSSASITERVRAGETLVGTFLNLGSPLAAEICARAGFDWCLIDLEHGAGTEAELIPTLQALGDTPGLVRIEANERSRFARALDAGAAGVMVPRIDSAADAAAAVSRMRYPPRGVRGVAYMNRGARFGLGAPDHDALCVIQIESPGAVEDVREIASLDGVDVLFVGPRDLSAALGTDDLPLDAVLEAARSEGKSAGIIARSREELERQLERGFLFVAVGSDSYFLAQASAAAAAPP